MFYHDVRPISRNEAEAALVAANKEVVCDALVRIAYYESDWKWAQDQCLNLAMNGSPEIKAVAVTCIGHIARIHGGLERDRVLAVLDQVARDPAVKGRVCDVLDDIQLYIGQPKVE